MADAATLSVLLRVRDDATRALEGFKSRLQGLDLDLKKVGFGVIGVGTAMALLAKSAAETEQVRGAFQKLSAGVGQSSDDILAALQKASAGTVNQRDLMLSANRAMVLGVAQNTEQFTQLMEIARDRAHAMGLTTQQAFDNIVTGIGRASPLILDNLGITVDAAASNEAYAKSIGKTAEALTDAERKQALLNAVLTQGGATLDRSALLATTGAEKFQKLGVAATEAKEALGELALEAKVPEFLEFIARKITETVEGFKTIAAAVKDPLVFKFQPVIDDYKLLGLTQEQLERSLRQLDENYKAFGKTLTGAEVRGQFNALADAMKRLKEEAEKASAPAKAEAALKAAREHTFELMRQQAHLEAIDQLLADRLAPAEAFRAAEEAAAKELAEETRLQEQLIGLMNARADAAKIALERSQAIAEAGAKAAAVEAKAIADRLAQEMDAARRSVEAREQVEREFQARVLQLQTEAAVHNNNMLIAAAEAVTRAHGRELQKRLEEAVRAAEQQAARVQAALLGVVGGGAPMRFAPPQESIEQAFHGFMRNVAQFRETFPLGFPGVGPEPQFQEMARVLGLPQARMAPPGFEERVPTLDTFAALVRQLTQQGNLDPLITALNRFGQGLGIPGFAHGGEVPGPMGAPQLAVVHGGETVVPAGGGRGGNIVLAPVFNNYGVLGVDDAGQWLEREMQSLLRRGAFPQIKRR